MAPGELIGKPRQFRVEVPEGVEPGKTKLRLKPGDSALLLTVPEGAVPGDLLVLTEGTDGTWACYLSRGTSAVLANSDQKVHSCNVRKGEVQIPLGAIPGKTKLQVTLHRLHPKSEEEMECSAESAAETFVLTVPQEAQPGDRVEVSTEGTGKVLLRILRQNSCLDRRDDSQTHGSMGETKSRTAPLSLALTHLEVDSDACFNSMVEAVRDIAGSFVSPKLARGTAPALAIPGMVAQEPIEKDEVLIRMPAGLHISPETCRQVMPHLFAAVEALPSVSEGRRVEVALTACVAAVLRAIAFDLEIVAPTLWLPYAEVLLGERFDAHPYWRSLSDKEVSRVFEPSGEAAYARMMAGDAIALHELIVEGVRPEVLGPNFEIGLFLQARLCLLTREFDTPRGSALVPILDLCNHSATNPGAHQSWDLANDAMVVRALRAHQAGEEIYISYGALSSPLLLRTYGFAVPPDEEPAWTYAFQASELQHLCGRSQVEYGTVAAHLSDQFPQLSEVHLDARHVTEHLLLVLGACAKGGGDAVALLGEFCTHKIAKYERDPDLGPALAALMRVRERDICSSAWWTELPQPRMGSDQEQALWVKMSEFLCLTAHTEALAFASGHLPEERCLAAAAGLRRGLAQTLS